MAPLSLECKAGLCQLAPLTPYSVLKREILLLHWLFLFPQPISFTVSGNLHANNAYLYYSHSITDMYFMATFV